ncbi:MAG: hypothetical protein LWW91_08015, partial [Bacteroidales bacterium]|nr:hypothetical protein [Bacteroidales bacterium]
MITWDNFIYFAAPTVALWALAIGMLYRKNIPAGTAKPGMRYQPESAGLRPVYGSVVLALAGIILFATFILLMWRSLDRPPMRTMGETR